MNEKITIKCIHTAPVLYECSGRLAIWGVGKTPKQAYKKWSGMNRQLVDVMTTEHKVLT